MLKIIITRREGRILTALWDGTRILEFHMDEEEPQIRVGDIWLAKVKNVVRNIQAAFVEIQPGTLCFLPLPGDRKVREGEEFPVQVIRESVKTKAPVVTDRLSVSGRLLVLISDRKRIAVSSRIRSESRRDYVKNLLARYPAEESVGFIVRTNAEHSEDEELTEEAERLLEIYRKLQETSGRRTVYSCLMQGNPAWLNAVRDLHCDSPASVVTDQEDIFRILKSREIPGEITQIDFYQDSMLTLSQLYRLEHFLETALSRRVWLKSGGYLIIDYTEAMTVIDVNSGKYDGHRDKSGTFRLINLEAAAEIAAQLRLRNLSGIILVDFIDMDSEEDRAELSRFLRQELGKDPVLAVLVDFTALNLAEITRKKVRRSLPEEMHLIYSEKSD